MPEKTDESILAREELIGRGLAAEVYSWGDGRVVKLYPQWKTPAEVEREFLIAKAVQAAGFPAPAAYEMIEVGGRPGIVLERLHGISMLKAVEARPWTLFAAARQLGELHAKLHECSAPREMPSQRRQLENWIDAAKDFSEAEKQTARRVLAQLPEGDVLCHGDFHPDNILLTARGPVVIDWPMATRGHPLGDVAFTSLILRKAKLPAALPSHVRLLFKISRSLLHRTYLQRYFRLRPGTHQQLEAWLSVLAVAVESWRIKGVSQLNPT